MKPIRYLITDDNEIDRLTVGFLAEAYPGLIHCGSFDNALDALEAIRSVKTGSFYSWI